MGRGNSSVGLGALGAMGGAGGGFSTPIPPWVRPGAQRIGPNIRGAMNPNATGMLPRPNRIGPNIRGAVNPNPTGMFPQASTPIGIGGMGSVNQGAINNLIGRYGGAGYANGGVLPGGGAVVPGSRSESSLAGVFNPGAINPSLVGAFNPGRGSTQLDSGLESSRSMMDMAAQYRASLPAPPPGSEFFMPGREQDDYYRAQYESTGYIPRGGWESIYEDPSAMERVYVGDKAHYAPIDWAAQNYEYTAPVSTRRSDATIPGYYTDPMGTQYEEGTPGYGRIETLGTGSTLFGGRPEGGSFGSTGTGIFGAPASTVPAWRMNGGGIVRGYRTGGLGEEEVIGAAALGGGFPPGGGVPPGMGGDLPAAPGPGPMEMGLGGAPAALGAAPPQGGGPEEVSLQDIGSMFSQEQLQMIIEEIRMALMGRHPQGDQILAITTEMFGPEFIEEIAVSIQGGGGAVAGAVEEPGPVPGMGPQGGPMMGEAPGGLIPGYQGGGMVSDGMSDSIPRVSTSFPHEKWQHWVMAVRMRGVAILTVWFSKSGWRLRVLPVHLPRSIHGGFSLVGLPNV